MYAPSHFDVADRATALAFMRAHSFGLLISTVAGRPCATQLPFLVAPDGRSLRCHMARRNPQWETLEGQDVLATFQGPHGYVSPAWYGSAGVPTWNYQAVQVRGAARLITDREPLRALVDALTSLHEGALDDPWVPRYSDAMLDQIVGVELELRELRCKFKLSQNRSRADRERVIQEHREHGSIALAEAMRVELDRG